MIAMWVGIGPAEMRVFRSDIALDADCIGVRNMAGKDKGLWAEPTGQEAISADEVAFFRSFFLSTPLVLFCEAGLGMPSAISSTSAMVST